MHPCRSVSFCVQAQELDTESEWSEQLKWLGERLQLRSQLYLTPPSPLQHAAQILEQVHTHIAVCLASWYIHVHLYAHIYMCVGELVQ